MEHVLSARVLASLTAGLVIIDEDENVRLTHKTAEYYFSQNREILFTTGDVELAECCLAYLQLAAFEEGPCTAPNESDAFDARLKEYPVNKGGRTPVRTAKDARKDHLLYVVREARDNEYALDNKHEVHLVRHQDTFTMRIEQSLSTAGQQSHLETLRARITRTNVDEINEYTQEFKKTPLHMACDFRTANFVQILLDAGAFVDPMDAFHRTPLTIAC